MSRFFLASLAAAVITAISACAGSASSGEALSPELQLAGVSRPIPQAVTLPRGYREAIKNGSRTRSGEPGPSYWQQWTDYRLAARLMPEEKRLEGSADIVYHNNSPHELPLVVLHLIQNLHAEGAPRRNTQEVTGGVNLSRVAVGSEELHPGIMEGPGYLVSGTRLMVRLGEPLQPADSLSISIEYSFTVPQAGADGRMGWSGDNMFFIAYWYPQMAVFDDVEGWQIDQFTGDAEFYAGFGSYELTVEAPVGWMIMATGELLNPREVLAPHVLERLRQAEGSDEPVQVLTQDDFGERGTASSPDGWLTWRYHAEEVRDVAFSATKESLWSAARTSVGDRDADGVADYVRIDAIYRKSAPRWADVVGYAQHSINFLSRFTQISYPWPHMTAVEGSGIIGGGMEFPMMTLIGDYNSRGDSALYYVTAHELAHMWVPMIISNDERRYSWMDEGTTSFNENQARKEYFPGRNHDLPDAERYIEVALAESEGEMMRRSDFHYTGVAFSIASYSKPASVLVALRGVLGAEDFMRAYRAYLKRWAYKHPYPWDMFNTFESITGRDLDWFWRSWYYETWVLDQAVASVVPIADGTRITISDRGQIPMPVRLVITRENGEVIRRETPVDNWLAGATQVTVTVPRGSPVVRVEIDPERFFPDVNRENNIWSAAE